MMKKSSFHAKPQRFPGWLLVLMLAVSLLASCGGTDGDAPAQTPAPLVELTGNALSADATLPFSNDAFTIKGASGLARPGQFTAPHVYRVKLDQLTGPYALGLVVDNDTTKVLVSIATRSGTANVTPLTTLVVAQALGADPALFFNQLPNLGAGSGTLANVTAERLTAAQQQIKRYLRQRLGVTVSDAAGDLITASFRASAGDPMYDAIVALNTRLHADGQNVLQLAHQIAAQALLCNAAHLTLTTPTDTFDFCPSSKSAAADPVDTSITNYTFADETGASLTVAARGDTVLSATYTNAQALTSSCSGAGCTGLSLGAVQEDQTRNIVFANVVLNGAAGRIVVAGTLVSAKPGVNLPPLPCDDNRYYIIRSDGTVDATCALPDTLGVGVGESWLLGQTRRQYFFTTDGSVEPPTPSIEVRADGETLASVVVYDQDPDTGMNRALFKCVGTACNGAEIGPAVDDPDSFAPYIIRTRTIVLTNTVLAAVGGGDPVTVRASLNSVEYVLPPIYETGACASPTQRVVATLSDEADGVDICTPADVSGSDLALFFRTVVESDGSETMHMGSLISSAGSSSPAGGLDIRVADGAVASIRFLGAGNAAYECLGAACVGIDVSAPDGAGQRTVTATGVVLTEVELGGLSGTRTAKLNGGFVSAAPAGSRVAVAPRVAPRATPRAANRRR